ncbi:mechanosensitive ion channel family protein [Fibrella forsythiae]|uniref:Mechanosensitive ion channel n=1 Tax=Fibrella forsythiae TaxID=2817061 RepID=A0ABS3JGY2_9BACT|nr:mechanosensitive ion channel domain-containing protein [Fibrella forsythiae]MBO0948152.1 mechanosensitive ion channel [Fibrella forsythiae]
MNDLTHLSTTLSAHLTQYGWQLLMAGLMAAGGLWLIKLVTQAIGRLMNRQGIERDVQPFLLATLRIGLRVALLLSVLSALGVETSSFVAVIGAAGLAVGLALQNSLANFAGGLLLLAFKPFRVGDLIAVQGFTGYVEAVHLFNTILITSDNRTLTLPNNSITTNSITNYTLLGTLRVDAQFQVDRDYDIDQVRGVIEHALTTATHLLPDHHHEVLLSKLTADALQFDVRVWINAASVEEAPFVVQEAVARAFARHKITGPRNVVEIGSRVTAG